MNLPINQEFNPLRQAMREYFKGLGYEIVGEMPKERPPEPLPPPPLPPKYAFAQEKRKYVPFPPDVMSGEYQAKRLEQGKNFFQQLKDVAVLLAKGKLDPFGLAFSHLIRGLTLGGIDDPIALLESLSGKPGLKEALEKTEREYFTEAVGYYPAKGLKAIEIPAEIAGSLVTFSAILRGIKPVIAKVSDIPIIRSLARAEILGTISGLARKPEDEGLWNRVEQIPGNVFFFFVLDTGLLAASQVARIISWKRKWKGVVPRAEKRVPAEPVIAEPVSEEQVKAIFNKMKRSLAGDAEKLNTTEQKIVDEIKSMYKTWQQGGRKKGWIPAAEVITPAVQVPRRPRMADIFRRERGLPVLEEPIPYPEAEAPPTAPPIRPTVSPELPPARPTGFRPVEPRMPPTPPPPPLPGLEMPTTARPAPKPGIPAPIRAEGAPQVTLDITPKPEGGWVYTFKPTPPATEPIPRERRLPSHEEIEIIKKKLPIVEPERKKPKPRALQPIKYPLVKEIIDRFGGFKRESLEHYWEGEALNIFDWSREFRLMPIVNRLKPITGGSSVETVVEWAREAGIIKEELPEALFAAIEAELKGSPTIFGERADMILDRQMEIGERAYAQQIEAQAESLLLDKLLKGEYYTPGSDWEEETIARLRDEFAGEIYKAEARRAVVEAPEKAREVAEKVAVKERPIEEILKERAEDAAILKTQAEILRQTGKSSKDIGEFIENVFMDGEKLRAVTKEVVEKKKSLGDAVSEVKDLIEATVAPVPEFKLKAEEPPLKVRPRPEPIKEPELFGEKELERRLPEEELRGKIRTYADINKTREAIQPYADDGWNIRIGQTTQNKGFAHFVDKAKEPPGKIEYIKQRVTPEALRKKAVQYEIPEEAPTLEIPKEVSPAARKFIDDNIEKIFGAKNIPREMRGPIYEKAIETFDPKRQLDKTPRENLEAFVMNQRRFLDEVGEEKLKTGEAERRAERIKMPEEERAVSPEGEYEAKSQEEFAKRINPILEKVIPDAKDRKILFDHIVERKTFEAIAEDLKISRQAVEQKFSRMMDRIRKSPEFQRTFGNPEYIKMYCGFPVTEREIKDLVDAAGKWLSPRRGMTRTIDKANDDRIGARIAEVFEASIYGTKIRKFLDKYKNVSMADEVLDALEGKKDIDLYAIPEEIKEAVHKAREQMDRLTNVIIAHAGLASETEAAFRRNMGKYLGKFYRIYEQKRWDPPKEIRNRYKAFLKKKYPSSFGKFTEAELDAYLEQTLRKKDFIYTTGTGRKAKIPTGHFVKRKHLDKEFREFAGEIADPVWLYIKTVGDQAAVGFNARFIDKIVEYMPEEWSGSFKIAAKKGWKTTRLPDSIVYGKLMGKYVSNEVREILTQELRIEPGRRGLPTRLIEDFLVMPWKWTKTVGSIPTHARNTLANIGFSILMRNSILNPLNLPNYFEASKILMSITRKEDTHLDYWKSVLQRRLGEVQFYGGEIPLFFKGLLRLDPTTWPEKIFEFLIKKPGHAAGLLYNYEDLIYRIAADLKNQKYFGMIPEASATEINRGMTNYAKLPLVVDFLRKYTIFGQFVSFRANVVKILLQQGKDAIKELGSKEAKTRARGVNRALRWLLFVSIPTLLHEGSKELINQAGVDKDLIADIESLYPPWRKHGRFFYFLQNRKLKVVDLTYIWPTGDIERAIRSLFSGDIESFKEALSLFAHPFFDFWSIMVQGREPQVEGIKYRGIMERVAAFVKQTWLPASLPLPSLKGIVKGEVRSGALTSYQIDALIRAYHGEPDEYGRVKDLGEELKNFFTGIKTWNVDPKVLIEQTEKSIKSQTFEAKREYQKWLMRHPFAAKWEREDKSDKYMKLMKKLNVQAETILRIKKKIGQIEQE